MHVKTFITSSNVTNIACELALYVVLNVNLRTCSLCNSNQIEDKSHFLFSCEHLYDTRKKFFDDITDKYRNFNDLDNIKLPTG